MLNGVPRILIIRLSAIGDVVRVLPALHALRGRFPHAQIDWLVEPKSAEIITEHPCLDQVLTFERKKDWRASVQEFRRTAAQIRAGRYDIVLDFHGILKSGLFARASRAPQRLGFAPPRAQEGSWLFYNSRVRLPQEALNRVEENLLLAGLLEAENPGLDATIAVPDEAQEDVEAFLDKTFHGGKKLAVLHVMVERPEKQWPLRRFSQLADMLQADGRFDVLLTWGPGQREQALEVAERCQRRPVVAPELAGLKELAWLLHEADLYCGGDTGPMHIASVMGAGVVGIFGGTDPARHAPLRDPSAVLYAGPAHFPKRMTLDQAQANLEAIDAEAAYDACVGLCFPAWNGVLEAEEVELPRDA